MSDFERKLINSTRRRYWRTCVGSGVAMYTINPSRNMAGLANTATRAEDVRQEFQAFWA